MKKEYPIYSRKGDLQNIKNSLSPKNKAELDKFAEYLLRTNKQPKVDKIFRQLIAFYDVTGLNFYDKPTIEVRDKFLALLNNSHYKKSYKREVKVYLKKWIRWRWKDLTLLEDFPKLEGNESDKVQEKDLITEEEFKKLLSVEKNDMWKALLSLLYASGCRPEEALNLKWESINFGDDITDIQFTSKKKTSVQSRVFPLDNKSSGFLKDWKNVNPNSKKDDYVFPSKKNKSISIHGLNFHLKELAKKSGIEKNIFPYLFRFTLCSKLYDGKNNLDDRNVANLMGHSVAMAGRYHKISNKTAREKLIEEIYKTKQLTKETKHKLEIEIESLKQNLLDITIEKDKWFVDFQDKMAEQQNKFYEKIKEKGWLIKNPKKK